MGTQMPILNTQGYGGGGRKGGNKACSVELGLTRDISSPDIESIQCGLLQRLVTLHDNTGRGSFIPIMQRPKQTALNQLHNKVNRDCILAKREVAPRGYFGPILRKTKWPRPQGSTGALFWPHAK